MSPSPVTRPRRVFAAVLLAAVLIAGCGGGTTEGLDAGPVAAPTGGAGATAPEADIPAAASEPVDAAEYEVQPETYVEPESETEPETDAERWVDGRQDDVMHDVYENNMDAIEGWTP